MIGDVMFGPIAEAIKSAFREGSSSPGPGEGLCPDWLAYSLGIAAGMTLVLTIISALMYNFN